MTFHNKGMAKGHPRFVALNPSVIFTTMKALLSTPPHGNLSLPEQSPLGTEGQPCGKAAGTNC